MLSVDEYLSRVLGLVSPLPVATTKLVDALGRVLAEEVRAVRDSPAFDNSSMDGYAVRSQDFAAADSPVQLRVVATVAAGDVPDFELLPGTSARIMTGAPLPAGADAVVPIEDTDAGLETVTINVAPMAGACVRPAGADLPAGALAVAAGTEVTPRNLAMLANCDRRYVDTHARPRVAVITIGDELVPAGAEVGSGKIVDTNGPLLEAALTAAGCKVKAIGPIADDSASFGAALDRAAAESDLIVTSGGVSMGAFDTVKEVLSLRGVEFMKVAMNPGMPQGCGRVGEVPVITLPGNPVSTYVSFEMFVRPAVRLLQGHRDLLRPRRQARLAVAMTSPAAKTQLARGILRGDDELVVTPVSGQGSHHLNGLSHANALIIVPPNTSELAADSKVTVIDLRPGG